MLVATMFQQMGLVSVKTATRVVYLDAILYLGAGIIGTGHHWYFTGQSTINMGLAATFSAMEVLQLHDALSHGYWHARRLTFLMSGTFHTLEWVRISGDMVFLLLGALPILIASVRSIAQRDAAHSH